MTAPRAPALPDPALADAAGESEPRLVVDVGGYEGPLDLLLDLARQQKVDLHHISILALAEQYLAFIAAARQLRLELAADYLLMAAWLAYLKSRLLLPEPPRDDEPSGEEMAEVLAERLRRLDVIRRAGEALMARPRLDADVFARGMPEGLLRIEHGLWDADLVDLLKAYAAQRAKQALAHVKIRARQVWSLKEARAALEKLVGIASHWTRLDEFLLDYLVAPEMRASVLASSFASSLELVREGVMELRQEGPFRPLYARRRTPNPEDANAAEGGDGR